MMGALTARPPLPKLTNQMVSESKSSVPRRSQRHEEAEARREQIVDQAISLIGQKGYQGMTFDQLATRCGVTKGGVLYHFPSKEHLLITVVDECTKRDSETISRLIGEDGRTSSGAVPSRSDVLRMLRIILGYSSANPELALLLAVLQLEAIDPDYPAHEQLQAANKAALERYTQLLSPISDAPLSMARRVAALMSGLTQQWLSEDRAFDLFAEWDRAIDAVLQEPGRIDRISGGQDR